MWQMSDKVGSLQRYNVPDDQAQTGCGLQNVYKHSLGYFVQICGWNVKIVKISKISDIFEVENIGYISRIYIIDIYHANPACRLPLVWVMNEGMCQKLLQFDYCYWSYPRSWNGVFFLRHGVLQIIDNMHWQHCTTVLARCFQYQSSANKLLVKLWNKG